jgi:hypothetical protein
VTGSVGIAIEVLVALLLIVTIGYCVLLNRKLGALRQDENAMRGLTRELTEATGTAERAIQSLKTSAADWDRALGARMRHAERVNEELGARVDAGQDMVGRLNEAMDASNRETVRLQRSAAAKANRAKPEPATGTTPAPATARARDLPRDLTGGRARDLRPNRAPDYPSPAAEAGTPARVTPAQNRTPERAPERIPATPRPRPRRLERDDRLGPELERPQRSARAARQAEADHMVPVAPQRFDNDDRLHDRNDARMHSDADGAAVVLPQQAGQRRAAG